MRHVSSLCQAICVSVLVASLVQVDLANAQPATRADEYAEAQAKKAAAPIGPVETRGERIARVIDKVGTPPNGFFPFFGNIYPSSWIAFGPGYRRPFENGAVVMTKGAWSVRDFKTADVQIHSPRFVADRLQIQGDAGWLDAPRVKFFGVGNDTNRDDRVLFGLRPAGGNVAMQFKAARFVSVGGGFGVERYESRQRAGVAPPDLDLTLRTTTISAIADWRPSPGWANSGGTVRVMWKGRRADDVAFDEYEAEATELVPILRGNWVIALRGLATVTDTQRGDIPFFLLPNVGGPTTRGFSNFRFRDRHRLATSAELRWSASQFMDLAVFVDAARVAATRRQLDFDDLHTSWGVGARFHTPAATVFRAEIARSTEGVRFTIGAGPVF
jgi:hypothetical protein